LLPVCAAPALYAQSIVKSVLRFDAAHLLGRL